mgnify:CR=1 FL=1
MSPIIFSGVTVEHYVNSNGNANDGYGVSGSLGARPVFNLKSEVLLQGTGTASDPYHLA